MHVEQSSKYLQGMYKVILTMLHGNLESFLARLHLCNNMKTSSKNIFYATRFLLLVSMM